MSAFQTGIVVELPVITVMISSLAAYGYRRLTMKLDLLTLHMHTSTANDATLRRDVDVIQVEVAELKRGRPPLSEAVAVVASELEGHLRWHERHPL